MIVEQQSDALATGGDNERREDEDVEMGSGEGFFFGFGLLVFWSFVFFWFDGL